MDRSYDRDRDERLRYRGGDWDRGEEYRRRDWEDRSRDWARRTGDRAENWAERTGERLENWADRAGNKVRSWFDDDDDRRRGEPRRHGSYDYERSDRERPSSSYAYGRELDRGLERGGSVRRDYDFGRRHLEDAGYSDRWHSRDRDEYDRDRRDRERSGYGAPTSYRTDYGSTYGTSNRSQYGSARDRERNWDRQHDWNRDRSRDWGRADMTSDTHPEDRGFFERAGDEVRSWFGDEDAERRRRIDERYDRADDRRNSGSGYGTRTDRDNRRDDDGTWW